jgi:hypothetical protein
MTERHSPGGRRATPYQPPGVSQPHYEEYVPGAGYTPPYNPPPLPPKGLLGRGRLALRNYGGLRRHARADSMAWWGYKFLQGLLFGGGPFAIGVLLVALSALLGGVGCLSGIGVILVAVGLVVLLRYALAPATCHWIVTVPENKYWVVEDRDGYTLEYLPPGRMIVPWRWNSKVRNYVDFNAVTITQVVDDVLSAGAPRVDVEVSVGMTFNPVEADPEMYASLRALDSREKFEAMLARDVLSIVRRNLNRLPSGQQDVLRHPEVLEDVIAEQLERHQAWGLFLASGRPVTVTVRGLLVDAPYQPPASVPPGGTPSAGDSSLLDTAQHDRPSQAAPSAPPADVQVEQEEDRATRRGQKTPPGLKTSADATDPLIKRRRRKGRVPPER